MPVRCRFDDFTVGRAFELGGLARVLRAETVDEVAGLLVAVDAEIAAGGVLAGFVSYEAAPAFDTALTVVGRDANGAIPLAWFGVFERWDEVALVDLPLPAGELAWDLDRSRAEYDEAFEAIQSEIVEGWTYEVNFTAQLSSPFDGDPFNLYRQLAHAQRGAYHGYLATDEFAIVCGSPELFFSLEDGRVTTRPMKGTTPRGRFDAEDAERADALVASEKERAENLMIVDLLRNDLGRVAPYGGVSTSALFALERYPTVWQLTSTVEAIVGSSGLADFAALFPCGSVTGAPKASTMSIIARLEGEPRGPYCGAFGWATGRGGKIAATFAVPIRTAVVDRVSCIAHYGVGSAIVVDSTADGEWSELATKAAVLTEPTAAPDLLETLRWETEVGFVHLERHLARLFASAERLGHQVVPSEIDAALAALGRPSVVSRVRILVARDGRVRATTSPLEQDATGPVRLGIARVPVDREDRRLFVKTADRERYDVFLAGRDDCDDVVLWNGDGEATETTRANLLIKIGGRWWTPPLACGLLPGVGRAVELDSGAVDERVITLDELAGATSIEVVSSLRGRRRAVLVDPPPVTASGAKPQGLAR